jgi:hypothetical protein
VLLEHWAKSFSLDANDAGLVSADERDDLADVPS